MIKKWLDEVLTHGWAYGSHGGDKFVNRKVALAVSTGIKKEDYRGEQGRYHYTLEQLLTPLKQPFAIRVRTIAHFLHFMVQSINLLRS